jgi:hypothetical protein
MRVGGAFDARFPLFALAMQYQASAASRDGGRIGEGEHAHAKEVVRATIR